MILNTLKNSGGLNKVSLNPYVSFSQPICRLSVKEKYPYAFLYRLVKLYLRMDTLWTVVRAIFQQTGF